MNPTETFPHVADPGTYTPRFAQCRCGSVRLRVSNIDAPRSWGENCPAALREALEAERARVAELEATLANERGEGEPPVPGWLSVRVYGNGKFSPGWRREDIVVVRLDVEFPWRVFLVDGTMFSPVQDADGRPASAPTARAAMRAAPESPAARSAGGGGS